MTQIKDVKVCEWCGEPLKEEHPKVGDMHLHCSVEEGDSHIINEDKG